MSRLVNTLVKDGYDEVPCKDAEYLDEIICNAESMLVIQMEKFQSMEKFVNLIRGYRTIFYENLTQGENYLTYG